MLITRPFTNAELRKLLEDLAARHFAPGDSSVDRGLIAEAARRLTEAGWLPIATAPRDGKNLLLRFGEDGVSQGKYIPGLPHPWLFIDTSDGKLGCSITRWMALAALPIGRTCRPSVL